MKNLDGRSLFGITLEHNNILEVDDAESLFTLEYDSDDEQIWKFNRPFETDFYGDDKPIRYHYYIVVTDYRTYDDSGAVTQPSVELCLCPDMEFIGENIINAILEDYEWAKKEDIRFDDIRNQSFYPSLCHESIELNTDDWELGGKWFNPVLETLSCVIPSINGLIGFYMDRSINLMGTTNWDALEEMMGGKGAIETTIDRYHSSKQN